MKQPRLRQPPAIPATPAPRGEPTASDRPATSPGLPHEHDESSAGQGPGTPGQKMQGKRAYRNATDGTTDTDKGPVMERIYDTAVAPDRGAAPPRR